jgi:putative membrane-bound dehydrogenase-like protein
MRFVIAACVVLAGTFQANAQSTAAPRLSVPEGFSIELAAASPLVERPIVAAFDEAGRLYVAESSGSNDPVQEQLQKKPHRISRLEDSDGDGKFDKRTLFADRMMFPEGAMFFDGSLYVSAPPSIWKLTDKDGDGIADERVEWFQGKTLTGCANDLHGPYAGPDGWIYWCKGAFAEQTHTVNGHPWTTSAAHVFRCRPDGSGLEPVITGGMDNPVDVVFTPDGEPILSSTFLGTDPRRDGLVHAVYGSVFGKEHGVLEGHPRTGELMPDLVSMTQAAPCGLERYNSNVFGEDFRHNLFTCQFNLRQVSRHILQPSGSSYASANSPFVTSEDVDFHPTDVLMDADGSLLVLDTGGWYKLCCPTSQLWKPDILGAIYRVRRIGAAIAEDPRGLKIQWAKLNAEDLWHFLADGRSAVRARAERELVRRGESAEVQRLLAKIQARDAASMLTGVDGSDSPSREEPNPLAASSRAWAVANFDTPLARQLVRAMLSHPADQVRHIALHAVSLRRDAEATPQLLRILASDAPANRRAAAEALGRIGDRSAVAPLLAAASAADDRALEHSIIYALIQLQDPTAAAKGLASENPHTRAAAMIALDQMPGANLQAGQVVSQLNSAADTLRHAAGWIVAHHPEWAAELKNWLSEQLASLPPEKPAANEDQSPSQLESLLLKSIGDASVQDLVGTVLQSSETSTAARELALRVVARAKLEKPPQAWAESIAKIIAAGDPALSPLAVTAAASIPPAEISARGIDKSLLKLSDAPDQPLELRVAALAAAASTAARLTPPQFNLLIAALTGESLSARSAAAQALSQGPLSADQLTLLAAAMNTAAPLELNRLLAAFEKSSDDNVAQQLLASLRSSPALPSLRIDLLRQALAHCGAAVKEGVNEVESQVNVDAVTQRKRIEALLPLMVQGDVRRGHAVFYSAKAACSACHRLGYAGGAVGPDLSHIGQTRTERDLLESILYPSLSFVRSYEPVLMLTSDGKAINGRIRDETKQAYFVATGPNEEVVVPREDVEQIQPSAISVMPAGLDKQLTDEQLADLVAFLRHAK